MKSKSKTLIAFICTFIFGAANAQDKVLEAAINSEFDILRAYAMEPLTKIQYDYSVTNSSLAKTPSRTIVVNIPQLKEMVAAIGSKYKTDIVRLIVAHELGHQIQYTHYGNVAGGLLYECQADLIAGFLMYQMTMSDIFEWINKTGIRDPQQKGYKAKIDEINGRSLAALTVIFGQGANAGRDRTHPSNEERRLALRDGFNYGHFWLYAEFLANVPTKDGPAYSEANRKIVAERYRKLLNYLPADNLLTWSSRHTRKIIHDRVDNCKDIIVYTIADWDTSSENPFVYYEQKIINAGPKVITLSFCNQVYVAGRADPANTLYWDLESSNSYNMTMRPGQTRDINDSLRWFGDKEYMPTFVYLGRKGALFSCTTLEDNKNIQPIPSGNHCSAPGIANESLILGAYLSERDNLSSYIYGVGETYSEKFEGNITYLSSVEFPSAKSTKIEYYKRRNRYDLHVKFCGQESKVVADNSLKKIFKIFQDNQVIIKEGSRGDDVRDKNWNIYLDNEEIGNLYYFHNDGKYSVLFIITGIPE